MRQDLLALTEDDLVSLSNPGLVKRARRDVEAGETGYELEEDAEGNLLFRWSDGVQCLLKAGATLAQSECSCVARVPCRYVLRSVLAYQLKMAQVSREETEPAPKAQVWNPGVISDQEIEKVFGKTTINRARQRYEEGQVVELARSLKPTAHFHTLACTVRFLVENNPGYVKCDCKEEVPCSHALMAIWAFRQLLPESFGGIVSTQQRPSVIPTAVLEEIEIRLGEVLRLGISNLPQVLFDNLRNLESCCRREELIWFAEIIGELLQQIERYRHHDALFEAEQLARLSAELCARSDALRNTTRAVPELFIRGAKTDEITEIGGGRLVGLGALGKIGRKSAELRAFLQDTDTGLVLAVRQQTAFNESVLPQPASVLARGIISKGISLGALSSGQLVVKGAKRTAAYQLQFGRQAAVANPQTFQWENLRAPVLVEDFSELRAHLNSQPPHCLRPRHLTGNFFVCPLRGANQVRFSAATQLITATVYDRESQPARLLHPYSSWAGEGSEALLKMLGEMADKVCFISGQVQLSAEGEGLTFAPAALIFEEGERRIMVQPWLDRLETSGAAVETLTPASIVPVNTNPTRHYPGQVLAALGELYLLGLERADRKLIALWQHLAALGESYGFTRLVKPVASLAQALARRDTELNWQGEETAIRAALELGVIALVALDE